MPIRRRESRALIQHPGQRPSTNLVELAAVCAALPTRTIIHPPRRAHRSERSCRPPPAMKARLRSGTKPPRPSRQFVLLRSNADTQALSRSVRMPPDAVYGTCLTGAHSGSDDGGFDELPEFFFSFSCNSATSFRNSRTSASSFAMRRSLALRPNTTPCRSQNRPSCESKNDISDRFPTESVASLLETYFCSGEPVNGYNIVSRRIVRARDMRGVSG